MKSIGGLHWSLVFFLSLLSSSGWSSNHKLTCESNGILKSYQGSRSQSASPLNGDRLMLSDPVDSYYSNRSSDYSVSKIKNVIRSALKNHVDPYYSLSLITIENPETLKKSAEDVPQPGHQFDNLYEQYFGTVPLDSIALIDQFKCQVVTFPLADRQHDRVSHYLLKDFQGNDVLYREAVQVDLKSGPPGSAAGRAAREAKGRLLQQMLANAQAQLQKESKIANNLNYQKYVLAKNDCATGGLQLKSGGPVVSDCRGLISPQSKQETFTINAGAPKTEICQSPILGSPGKAGLLVTETQIKNVDTETRTRLRGCCAQVETQSTKPDEIASEVRDLLGFQFMNLKVRQGQTVAANSKTQGEVQKMSMVLQAFNGYGMIGGSMGESANRCLEQLNLKNHPVYGAGTAELELNMFLANPLIRQWVREETQDKPVKSVFCEVLGAGTHHFESTDFAKIQASAFAGRPCPVHSFREQLSKSTSGASQVPTAQ